MGLFDLQVNGYAGVDFCSADLTAEQCRKACEALRNDGIEQILATMITDHVDSLQAKLENFVRIRETDPFVAQVVAGFHVEGPFISPLDGYVGAHPAEAVVPANVEDARRLLGAGNGLIRLLTLAPEYDQGARTTAYLVGEGVTVSAGHCDPNLEALKRSIDAGLSMVTHLGNGCPVDLPRHDNFIQRVLSLSGQLWVGFIPDGAHVPWFALQNYIKLVGIDRTIVTTDAILAAGLGPGTYELSGAPVEIDESGVARRPGSPNLAGSTVRGHQVVENLIEHLGFSDEEVRAVFSDNPRAALGL
jgi:N-acetylglucosamine-6-phosphate deacetylase